MACKQEDEDESLILGNIQVNDSFIPPFIQPQPEPRLSVRIPQEINQSASLNRRGSITSKARRSSSSSSPEIQYLNTVKSAVRKPAEVNFHGFQTRYSKMKLIKEKVLATSEGLSAHLDINSNVMLCCWERTLKSNKVSENTNTEIEHDVASSPIDSVSQASEFTERSLYPSQNIYIGKEHLYHSSQNNSSMHNSLQSLPISNERLRHPSQSSSIAMSSPTIFSPPDDFRYSSPSQSTPKSCLPIGSERLRHPSQSSSIVMSSPTVLSPSDDFRNSSPSPSTAMPLNSPEDPRLRSKKKDRIQRSNSSSSLWNPDPPQSLILNSPSSDSRLSLRNTDHPQSSFRQPSPPMSALRNPDPPLYNVQQPTYENRLCLPNLDPPQHLLQSPLEKNPFWQDPRSSHLENNESMSHTINNDDSIRRIGSIDFTNDGNDKQHHSTQQPIHINSQTVSHVEQGNPEDSETKETVDIEIARRCTVYMKGLRCHKGDYCEKIHGFPREDEVVCKYFKGKGCRRSTKDCWFWHPGEIVDKFVPDKEAPLLVQPMAGVYQYIKKEQAKNPDKYKSREKPEVIIPSAVGNANRTPLIIPSAVGNANHTPLGQRQIGRLDPNHSPLLPHLKRANSTSNVDNSPLRPPLNRSNSTSIVDNLNVQKLHSPSTASKSDITSPSSNHIHTNSTETSSIEVSRIKRSKPAKVGAPRKKRVETINNISNGQIFSESVPFKPYKIPKKSSTNVNNATLINEKTLQNVKTAKVGAPIKNIDENINISNDQIVSDSASSKHYKIPNESFINANNNTLIDRKTSDSVKTVEDTEKLENRDITLNDAIEENLMKTNENNGKNIKSSRTRHEHQNSKKDHEENKEKSSKKSKETITHTKRKTRPISESGEEENTAEETSILNKLSSNCSSKERGEKMQGKNSKKPSKKANKMKKSKIDYSDGSDEDCSLTMVTSKKFNSTSKKFNSTSKESKEEICMKKSNTSSRKANELKQSKIESSDESNEETLQANLTKNRKSKSSCHESEEEIQPKKSIKLTKKANKLKKLRIESDEESEEDPQSVNTKNKKFKSGNESEEGSQVKKRKNYTQQIDRPRISRIESSNESEEEVPQTVITENKLSKSKIDVDKQVSKKIKDEPKKTNSKDERSKKEDIKKPVVIAEITLSDTDEESDIVKSEPFLRAEVDGVNNVRERKAIDDILWAITKNFDILEETSPWRRKPNQTEQDLYTVLALFNLEKIEDNTYPHIYILDVNYRQFEIFISGVNDRVQEHAWLCKHRFPNCKDIPAQHEEDMSCCT